MPVAVNLKSQAPMHVLSEFEITGDGAVNKKKYRRDRYRLVQRLLKIACDVCVAGRGDLGMEGGGGLKRN